MCFTISVSSYYRVIIALRITKRRKLIILLVLFFAVLHLLFHDGLIQVSVHSVETLGGGREGGRQAGRQIQLICQPSSP